MYINTPNTARGQVSEGYIISFKKVFSCFYLKKKKQLLEDCQILSSICFPPIGLLSEKVYYHNRQIIYKRETISLQLNRELNSAAASLPSVLFVSVSNTV